MTYVVSYNAQYCPKRSRARAAHVAAFDDLAARGYVAIGVCEAGGYRRELRRVDGMQVIQPRGVGGRCALLVRADVKVHSSGTYRLHGRKFVGRNVPGARVTGWTKPRDILWALITDPDSGELVVVAVWHPVPGQSHSKRARALLALEAEKGAAWLAAQKHPADLMGDTNGDPDLHLFNPLRLLAQPAFAVSRGGSRIDGHWIAGGHGTATALDGYPSNHKPVVADITWGKSAPAPKEPTVTETRVVDYSFAKPDPAAIKASGYVGAIRYIALGSGKLMDAAEAKRLRGAGLKIGLVAEGAANRATMSRTTGARDAQAALAAANALGCPKRVPIFAAVDFDANPTQVEHYLRGWASVLKGRAGCYAGIRVIDAIAGWMPWLWQTTAWSGGKLSPNAHVYQRATPQGPLPAGCDENVVCKPIPFWGGVLTPPGAAPAPAPTPAPVPKKPAAPVVKPEPNVDHAIADTKKALHNARSPKRKGLLRRVLAALRLVKKG